jgi:hypothetical protein
MKYYAKLWDCGFKTVHATTGRNWVTLYSFNTKSERDIACIKYIAPNHCPSAILEKVKASDKDICYEKRNNNVFLRWDI